MSRFFLAAVPQSDAPGGGELSALTVSLIFFALNAAVLSWVLWASQLRKRSKAPAVERVDRPATEAGSDSPERAADSESGSPQPDTEAAETVLVDAGLDAADVLGWEFEYARTTASEAMQDRHTMVNFYLTITGLIATGVFAVSAVGGEANVPRYMGTILLWLLCGVGWFYFLKLVKLRQAWVDSARTMNQIKMFFIENVTVPGADLREAFRWKPETMPPAGQPWTVFAYSASLIAFLDAAAFVGGGLLWARAGGSMAWPEAVGMVALGVAFFVFHVKLYFLFLREPGKTK